ncbi:Demethylrebeccamycin-D-glucose O-methyltransferase [Enhygromyxa salina]|uniref:Demethylrebeccamycin-D-glucose O-methyltransferase n=1 Tax=Enhygromyxa salina TaxID=215803 RepID=A0A2S9Y2N0_9BACT|nr:class I SAM-dependent methyltransferase [Enhygromyxa salina]PRP99364.1 Demethylrebeccamycin-D-glucose O-methyltransferase [Enhygromyxa salina]
MQILSAFRGLHNYTPLESLIYDSLVERAIGALHERCMSWIEPELRPGLRVLDVGCGGGQVTLAVAEREPEARVTGLDLSPEQIERAKGRGASVGDRVEFVEGSALDLPFDDGSFDLVYSLGSLKHWSEPARGLRECARVLTPGGQLIVAEGDRGCRPADVDAFISTWRVPGPAKVLARLFFVNSLVPLCLDLDDARAAIATVPKLDATVERAEGLPMLVIRGEAQSGGG